MTPVTDTTFAADVIAASSGAPVIVYFWAEWCGPCRMMRPIVDEVSRAAEGRASILGLNVDENPKTAARNGIMSLPTFIAFRRGDEAAKLVGAVAKQKLAAWVMEVVR